jgi:nucleoid DNA-binding protein
MGKMDTKTLPRSHKVRVPFLNTPEAHTPVRDCVVRAAERAGIEPTLMALSMAHFFEAITDQVTMKKVVRIPGFGAFGPKTRFRRVPSKFTGSLPCAYPAFVASPAFKLEVRMRVRPAMSPESDPMRRLSRNGSARQRHSKKSLDETFRNVRRAITECNDESARSRRQKIT